VSRIPTVAEARASGCRTRAWPARACRPPSSALGRPTRFAPRAPLCTSRPQHLRQRITNFARWFLSRHPPPATSPCKGKPNLPSFRANQGESPALQPYLRETPGPPVQRRCNRLCRRSLEIDIRACKHRHRGSPSLRGETSSEMAQTSPREQQPEVGDVVS
jgi:hypothetical protein